MSRSGRAILLGAAGALAWRVAHVLVWGRDPLVFSDGLAYHLQAIDLANGLGWVDSIKAHYMQGLHQTAQHPPLFTLVLFTVTRTGRALGLGSSDATVVHQLTCAVLSTAGVVVIGFTARRLAGERAGIVAAVIAAVLPQLWVNDALVMSESLVVLTTALVLLTVVRYVDEPTTRRAALLGLALGAAMLARSEAALLVAAVGVPIAIARGDATRRACATRAAMVVIVAGVVVAPWVVRNLTTFDRPELLSENLDSVLAGANCPSTYYGTGLGSWDFACNAANLPAGDESVQGAELRRRGLSYVHHHTSRVPVVVAARLGRVLELYRPMSDRNDAGRPS